ncbi:hypothetical protein CCH79_00017534, partial [Gambusia affinis]
QFSPHSLFLHLFASKSSGEASRALEYVRVPDSQWILIAEPQRLSCLLCPVLQLMNAGLRLINPLCQALYLSGNTVQLTVELMSQMIAVQNEPICVNTAGSVSILVVTFYDTDHKHRYDLLKSYKGMTALGRPAEWRCSKLCLGVLLRAACMLRDTHMPTHQAVPSLGRSFDRGLEKESESVRRHFLFPMRKPGDGPVLKRLPLPTSSTRCRLGAEPLEKRVVEPGDTPKRRADTSLPECLFTLVTNRSRVRPSAHLPKIIASFVCSFSSGLPGFLRSFLEKKSSVDRLFRTTTSRQLAPHSVCLTCPPSNGSLPLHAALDLSLLPRELPSAPKESAHMGKKAAGEYVITLFQYAAHLAEGNECRAQETVQSPRESPSPPELTASCSESLSLPDLLTGSPQPSADTATPSVACLSRSLSLSSSNPEIRMISRGTTIGSSSDLLCSTEFKSSAAVR